VSYDKVILPGEEGKVKVKVTTKGYGGNRYNKSVHVDTNDPKHATIELKISGDVKTFATIIPKSVYLNGKVGEKLTQIVRIMPETDEPFKIMKVTALNGQDISYSLNEIERAGKKVYELTVENKKEMPGKYFDTINIITDRSDQTALTVQIRGNIMPLSGEQPIEGENPGVPTPPAPEPPAGGVNK